MNGVPTTHLIALGLTALYGLVSIVGGIMGYVRANSVASLVAGEIAGVLLLLCAVGIFYLPAVALSGAIIIAVALLGHFVPSLLQQRDQLGEFLNTPKGMVALAMVVGGVLVIISSALALATKAGPPTTP